MCFFCMCGCSEGRKKNRTEKKVKSVVVKQTGRQRNFIFINIYLMKSFLLLLFLHCCYSFANATRRMPKNFFFFFFSLSWRFLMSFFCIKIFFILLGKFFSFWILRREETRRIYQLEIFFKIKEIFMNLEKKKEEKQ